LTGSKREAEIIKLVKHFKNKFKVHTDIYLDIGCGDGELTIEVSKILRAKKVYGLDINDNCLSIASKRGIITFKINLNDEKFPFEDNVFDLISSFDVIQYLINTDNLIREAYRVLIPGGYFIITTVNLASWVNRLLLLSGYLPFFCETSSLIDTEKRPFQRSHGVGGIVKLYTFKTLKRHLEVYGFRVIQSAGYSSAYVTINPVVTAFNKLFSVRKTLSANIFLVAVKK
jgi:ubiquinone/menaquinone biosynthesis C-methylase UbiE